ncbi:sensor histidine kinase [Fibrisoma limi]|uniref:sensor histidine kinase n=1 Tax=Fibrisoma limi TaxID=663275 RepID=UPI00030F885D|nr:histidine kinase dimerization/phosphoacceptor domain -containing protein [Fibrisoma limi]
MHPERLQKARDLEQQALASKNTKQLAEAYYQYGRTYVFAGNYLASQGYFLKSLRLLEPFGDSFELSRIYVRLGENESRSGRLPDAFRYARRSVAVAHRARSLRGLGLGYGLLSSLHQSKSDSWMHGDRVAYDSIMYYQRKKGAIYRSLNDTLGIAECSLELGTLYTKVKDDRAIPLIREAYDLMILVHRDRLLANVLLRLAEAYLAFDRFQLAHQALLEAEQRYLANEMDDYDVVMGLEQAFVLYYQATGQWEDAFVHQQKANKLAIDQLLSDRNGTIARLNVEYETRKKEALLDAQKRELALRTQTLETQRWLTIAITVLLVLAVGAGFTFFRLNRRNQRISRRNEQLVKEQNHRVKNNLQVISSLLNLQAKRLADEAARTAVEESQLRVQSMAILHRRLYDGDRLAEANLDEFIRELVEGVLRTYGSPPVQPDYNIDPIYLSADQAVPVGLILNELTTNACKYAFPGNDHPTFQVDCYLRSNRIHIRVTDNGPGFDQGSEVGRTRPGSVVLKKESFGMTLIKAQVNQLRGTYQFDPNQPTGTLFTMEFKI